VSARGGFFTIMGGVLLYFWCWLDLLFDTSLFFTDLLRPLLRPSFTLSFLFHITMSVRDEALKLFVVTSSPVIFFSSPLKLHLLMVLTKSLSSSYRSSSWFAV
jgi:hypothetical protein